MPEVGVTSEIIQRQIEHLGLAADEIGHARQAIMSQYQQLGSQWNDSKYRMLGDIVNESNASLRNIEKIFLQSQKSMVQILSAVTEYENTNLFGSFGTAQVAGSATEQAALAAATQTEHRSIITSHEAAVAAVISDVKNGSGDSISVEEAETLPNGVRSFSGQESALIRGAYNNPHAAQGDLDAMRAVDAYIRRAPRWQGTVYRGMNVSQRTAGSILSGETVDMLGPSSWSSELNVAERYSSMGGEPVRMIFVLSENQSGASITHLSTYNGIESEVTAPSDTQYHVERTQNITHDGRDFVYIYVSE